MAQWVVKRRDCRRLARSVLLAVRNGSLPVRMDWLGHSRLHHSRRVAMKDRQSAPADGKPWQQSYSPEEWGTLRAELTVTWQMEEWKVLTAIAAGARS